MGKFFITVALGCCFGLFSYASESELQRNMLAHLESVRQTFQSQYAPAELKFKKYGWDVDVEISKINQYIKTHPTITVHDYQGLLSDFFNSVKDYHVSISFYSTEKSLLPFTVQGVGDDFFIAYIDRTKLGESTFPFNIGDKLVTFGDQKTADAVKAIAFKMGPNNLDTNMALAALMLTKRSASQGLNIPKGTIDISIQPKGSSDVLHRQLRWDYTPELITDGFQDSMHSYASMQGSNENDPFQGFLHSKMLVPYTDLKEGMVGGTSNPFGLGTKKSYLPSLGEINMAVDKNLPFYAYTYKTPDQKEIGYIRIGNYSPTDAESMVSVFDKLIVEFEKNTDALVIDQINNPGGSVFYLYALASMLTNQPLKTPHHYMKITQAQQAQAINAQETLKNITTDEAAVGVFGDSVEGYPVSMQFVEFLKGFTGVIIDTANSHKSLTPLTYLEGVDSINPALHHYSKPVFVLINSLDFSGGDFFPAILQDNKRATILGSRTSGAGGVVTEVEYPNRLGVASYRLTSSLAERATENGAQPIENLGVTPNVEIKMTKNDLENNYADYIKTVNGVISKALK
jgi:hypothetical protein